MEFESMAKCFQTVQGDSGTTCNALSTLGPMAPIEWHQEPYGSSPPSTSTVSTAATMVPFRSPRFGTASDHCGRLLRKLLSVSALIPAVAAMTAAIAWSAHLATIPLSLVGPLLVYHAKSKMHAYATMFAYYSAASWPMIPGVRVFFGRDGTPLIGLFLCVGAVALLALPWGLLFTRKPFKASLFVPLCILIAAIPPLGVIGWASPLISAGVLFPSSKWVGLALILAFLSLFRLKPLLSFVCLAFCALFFHFHYTEPHLPSGWEAVNTNFGGVGQGEPDFAAEYKTHQSLQRAIGESRSTVLVFPEHLVAHWNESTDAFWKETLTPLAGQHRTVLIGAGVSPPAPLRNPSSPNHYLNVLLARGEENSAVYQQRIPVPLGMWKPISNDGVPLSLFTRGTIRIRDQNAAVLICYEQLLVWPFASSALEHPTILLASSNSYWARGTLIPAIQQSTTASWARLFHLPVLSASNL